MSVQHADFSVPRGNENQWRERRGGREVTITDHPVRAERVEFLNEPDDPSEGPLTLKFYLGAGHEVSEHTHPKQTETLTVNEGELEATVDGETQTLGVGDTVRIEPTVPHGYRVISDEDAVLSVSITPALQFKEFVIAEHALSAEDYPESGLNLPYLGRVSKRYGPMIAAPGGSLQRAIFGTLLSTVGRIKGLEIPDEPLPLRETESESAGGKDA